MKMTPEEYGRFVKEKSPDSPLLKDMFNAFWTGGLICVIGQGFTELYKSLALTNKDASAATSITLILIAAVLTGLGVYNKIAKFAGAGTLVPITGFSNAVTSPALEFKTEGVITGLAAKIFTIAGPVLVFGIAASVINGIVRWLVLR
ncbi:MAG: stage V sporulation protein AC [Oscillospiraceae bacterium]|nr:stage V sporulation protein AC [Oscillospiraceae bacterium]